MLMIFRIRRRHIISTMCCLRRILQVAKARRPRAVRGTVKRLDVRLYTTVNAPTPRGQMQSHH